ncbi:epimerase [Octadecabacter sp. CECT 8868]|uniref:epimerase n=1 Tax=Octadecabacter algicola TaxID=2909342 RepID=UPI001F43B442|nr:epimerase [Octadecabacter algicola]MCF2905873.1 epimerase [Octadecabacter algicola]
MQNTVLILGPTGRLGRNAALAFETAGWEVRYFDREKDTLWDAAWGASVIVNGWNPPYPQWAEQIPDQTAQIIEVAKAGNATVIIPGNVYLYGEQAPERFATDTPHLANNPLGRVRIEMEATYRKSGVQTIVVRAGDYLDTEASGNWFDMIIAKPVAKGHISYPGPLDCPHAFTYLPDVAATMVDLAGKRHALGQFEDVLVPSFTLTGHQLAQAIGDVLGKPIRAKQMAWWPLRAAALVWPMGRAICEMRYLWRKPHFIDAKRHSKLCPDLDQTPLHEALSRALDTDVHPDEVMWTSSKPVAAQ